MQPYGTELILDLHNCDTRWFNRRSLRKFLRALCDDILHMQREDLHFWDYKNFPEEYNQAPPHLRGTTAVQFIRTSNITIHCLDELYKVFINIFSCKPFDPEEATKFCIHWFHANVTNRQVIERQ